MTATSSNIVRRPASTWSTERKKGGEIALSAAEITALGTATTVREVLAIISGASRRAHVVTADGIGKATRVDA